jgi:hypothetical protein
MDQQTCQCSGAILQHSNATLPALFGSNQSQGYLAVSAENPLHLALDNLERMF